MLNYWCWKLCGVVTVDTSAERGMITFCLFRSKGVFECMHHSCVSLRRSPFTSALEMEEGLRPLLRDTGLF